MHALITAFGSAGDVYPFLEIGRALRRQGHAVTLLANPHFAARVAAAGLEFLPLGTLQDYRQALGNRWLWSRVGGLPTLWQIMQRQLLPQVAQLQEACRPDTVLVGSTLGFANRLLQDLCARPLVTVHLAPACFWSTETPPVLPAGNLPTTAPAWLRRRWYDALDQLVLDAMLCPGLNRIRQQLGLPPVRQVFSHWMHSPQRVLGAFPAWFAAPPPDGPPHTQLVGFPRHAAAPEQALSPMVQDFLAAGSPPLVFTAGSAMAQGARWFRTALATCRLLGARAVFVSDFPAQLPPLPPQVLHQRYVPFDRLLPHASGLIYHGGIGTLAQGVAAGVPHLVTPFAHDQFDNAARLGRLGIGATVSPHAPADDWAQAIRDVQHPSRRPDRLAWQHALEQDPDPAELAARHIVALGPV